MMIIEDSILSAAPQWRGQLLLWSLCSIISGLYGWTRAAAAGSSGHKVCNQQPMQATTAAIVLGRTHDDLSLLDSQYFWDKGHSIMMPADADYQTFQFLRDALEFPDALRLSIEKLGKEKQRILLVLKSHLCPKAGRTAAQSSKKHWNPLIL